MSPEDPDELHLRAACSYIELGMFDEAQAEMEMIDPPCRALSEVLASRIPLYRVLAKWNLMAIVARKLTEWNPEEPDNFIDWAYAIRRAESIHAAHAILKRGEDLHPADAKIQFNLACYEMQLGNVLKAKAHLKCAVGIDPKFKLVALEDPDLEPFWALVATDQA
jgi:tetratricopeptide (TPR) repeat protein